MTTEPTSRSRPSVFYVSYDGIGEPLGQSQVLAYLYRLADDYQITLFSYEKDGARRDELRNELAAKGIRWVPLTYHRRPPVLSTLMDVIAGVWAVRIASRASKPDLVHVRSYVPALVALLARRWTRARLLFDIRGFWADERVEGGIWPSDHFAYRLLYRVAKGCERWFFRSADAIVTLTHASVPQIRAWTAGRDVPIAVIPTCAELERFAGSVRRDGDGHLMWCGSVGTWYRFELAPRLAEALGWELDVLTRQIDVAESLLPAGSGTVRSLPPAEVPGAMRETDVGLCLYVASFSRLACAPTRFAEHLAAGMPVVVTAGVGDMDAIVQKHKVGVVLRGDSDEDIRAAAAEIRSLVSDPETPVRCRTAAVELFDVNRGVERYKQLYEDLVGSVR